MSRWTSSTPVKTYSGRQSMTDFGSLDLMASQTLRAGTLHPHPPQQLTSITTFYFELLHPILQYLNNQSLQLTTPPSSECSAFITCSAIITCSKSSDVPPSSGIPPLSGVIRCSLSSTANHLQAFLKYLPAVNGPFWHEFILNAKLIRLAARKNASISMHQYQYCFIVQAFHSSILEKSMRVRSRGKNSQLTLDFGPFSVSKEPPEGSLFQRVRSEMLKRKQRMALRRKPIEYEKLQLSLQEKLKQKTFNREEQRDQIVMLEKCKNYFQLRKNHEGTHTPKPRLPTRPHTSCARAQSGFMTQLQGVMRDCGNSEGEIKEDMRLFAYFCKMMDRRLEGIKNTIQKKERMA